MEKYPLDQLDFIKKKKLEEAEKLLREKKELLRQEEVKLKAVEAERDKVAAHKDEKLQQLRAALDAGQPTNKIEQMRIYLKLVKEELKTKQKKVDDQIKKVREAEKQVEIARQNLIEKQKNVEKLTIHRKEWQKEADKEFERKEDVEVDDISSSRHILRKKKKKHE